MTVIYRGGLLEATEFTHIVPAGASRSIRPCLECPQRGVEGDDHPTVVLESNYSYVLNSSSGRLP